MKFYLVDCKNHKNIIDASFVNVVVALKFKINYLPALR